jgi:hypothetical protein
LTKKGRALLARGRSVKITVSGAAVDAAGNRGTARTSAKLH